MDYLIAFSTIIIIIFIILISWSQKGFNIFELMGFYANLATLAGMSIIFVSILCTYGRDISNAATCMIILGWLYFLYRMCIWKLWGKN